MMSETDTNTDPSLTSSSNSASPNTNNDNINNSSPTKTSPTPHQNFQQQNNSFHTSPTSLSTTSTHDTTDEETSEEDHRITIGLIGPRGAGKSALIQRFSENLFDPATHENIPVTSRIVEVRHYALDSLQSQQAQALRNHHSQIMAQNQSSQLNLQPPKKQTFRLSLSDHEHTHTENHHHQHQQQHDPYANVTIHVELIDTGETRNMSLVDQWIESCHAIIFVHDYNAPANQWGERYVNWVRKIQSVKAQQASDVPLSLIHVPHLLIANKFDDSLLSSQNSSSPQNSQNENLNNNGGGGGENQQVQQPQQIMKREHVPLFQSYLKKLNLILWDETRFDLDDI